jgi:hypothetical protein
MAYSVAFGSRVSRGGTGDLNSWAREVSVPVCAFLYASAKFHSRRPGPALWSWLGKATSKGSSFKESQDTGTQSSSIINGEEFTAIWLQADELLRWNSETSRDASPIGGSVHASSFACVLNINEHKLSALWLVCSCIWKGINRGGEESMGHVSEVK